MSIIGLMLTVFGSAGAWERDRQNSVQYVERVQAEQARRQAEFLQREYQQRQLDMQRRQLDLLEQQTREIERQNWRYDYRYPVR